MDFQPTVYIMTNRRRYLPYIGVTSNLLKRIYEHREDIAEGYAKCYSLYRLVYLEQFATMKAATARAKQLQNWHRAWRYGLIEQANSSWRDLAEDFGFEALE